MLAIPLARWEYPLIWTVVRNRLCAVVEVHLARASNSAACHCARVRNRTAPTSYRAVRSAERAAELWVVRATTFAVYVHRLLSRGAGIRPRRAGPDTARTMRFIRRRINPFVGGSKHYVERMAGGRVGGCCCHAQSVSKNRLRVKRLYKVPDQGTSWHRLRPTFPQVADAGQRRYGYVKHVTLESPCSQRGAPDRAPRLPWCVYRYPLWLGTGQGGCCEVSRPPGTGCGAVRSRHRWHRVGRAQGRCG